MILQNLLRKSDERGYMMEIMRSDWGVPRTSQSMISVARARTLKAWHSHTLGQDDFLVVINGEAVVVYLDDPYEKFVEHRVSGKKPQLLYVPGKSWHGILSLTDTTTIYFVTKLYNYESPDEVRLSPDHEFMGVRAYNWRKWRVADGA